jgi:hypothetical protein
VPGTDFHAVVNRRIAVTPIHLDLTGRRLLRRLRTWQWDLPEPPSGGTSDTTADTTATKTATTTATKTKRRQR